MAGFARSKPILCQRWKSPVWIWPGGFRWAQLPFTSLHFGHNTEVGKRRRFWGVRVGRLEPFFFWNPGVAGFFKTGVTAKDLIGPAAVPRTWNYVWGATCRVCQLIRLPRTGIRWRIKRAVLAGRYAFSEKARIELETDALTEMDVAESISMPLQFTRSCVRRAPFVSPYASTFTSSRAPTLMIWRSIQKVSWCQRLMAIPITF